MKSLLATCICAILFLSEIYAQPASSEAFTSNAPNIHIKRTNEKISLDGILNEMAWGNCEIVTDLWQQFPTDSITAKAKTQIQMTYDEQNLYVGITCYSEGENFIVPSLRRDYDFTGSDNVTLVLDTYNDKTNAFVFGLNPHGVQREALISNGGREFSDFEDSWDNKWFGNAKIHGNYWVAEFAIPFKTLRFQEGSHTWRFNCYRSDTQHNEWSTWGRIPQNNLIMDLSYLGNIIWDEPLKNAGTNISVIPYVTTSSSRDFEDENQTSADFKVDIGGDAKIGITSGLNLDLTINPDFSQVEVDQQVTNLDRFEIFFPERRQFFLENADLFGSFGLTRVNPFFSRRIGIAIDTATGQNVQNRILYGARLSGKVNENLRLGLLNMQTAKVEESGLPAFNYTVATLQQKVFNRSNISFIFVNKQAINGEEGSDLYNKYNRVAGLEYRLASSDNRWSGKSYFHVAFTPEEAEHKFTHGFQIAYLKRKYRLEWAHLFIGNGYNAEVGFVPRKDYALMSPEVGLFFYPKKGIINQHSFNLDTRFFLQAGKDGNPFVSDFGLSEWQAELEWSLEFRDNTRGNITIKQDYVTLLANFDPTRLQDTSIYLDGGSTHRFFSLEGSYQTDQRKPFFFEIAPAIGGFYNGFRAGLSGSFTLRYQPYGFVSIDYTYNYIKLDEPFEPVNLWLVGPRIDLTFSKKLFLTTFIQYNNQLDNLNINARLQWRFQPVSDFFIVYTDNYLVDSFSQFGARNRAIVAKLTYWLNL